MVRRMSMAKGSLYLKEQKRRTGKELTAESAEKNIVQRATGSDSYDCRLVES